MDFLQKLFTPAQPDPNAELVRKLKPLLLREVNAIDAVFEQNKVEAQIDRQNIQALPAAGIVRMRVVNGAKVSKITSLEDDLSLCISELRGDDVTVKVRKPRLIIELPYPLEREILEWENAPTLGPLQAFCGMDYTALTVAPVVIDWSDKAVSNVLVSGTTGSGKTNGLIALVASLARSTSPRDAQIIILDPKFSLGVLNVLPHVTLAREPEDIAAAIAAVKAEINRRKRRRDPRKVFLVCEEIAELFYEAGDGKGQLIEQLKSIVQVGRELGVHVIACTQKATTTVVDTVLKSNLPIRLAFKVASREESTVATGQDGMGADRLTGKGAALFVNDGARRLIQTYLIDTEELPETLAAIAVQWVGVDCYRIRMDVEAGPVGRELPANVTQEQVDAVLEKFGKAGIFDDDGHPIYGIKIKIIKHIHGDKAKSAGHMTAWVDAIVSYVATVADA